MKLQALTAGTSVCVQFGLEDGPVVLSNQFLALTKSRFSPLLRFPTVCRVSEDGNFAEGTQVVNTEDDSLLGVVVYDGEFKLQTFSGALKEIPQDGYIKLVEANEASIKVAVSFKDRPKVLFTYKERVIPLHSFLGLTKDGRLYVSSSQRAVKPALLKYYVDAQAK